ncbi:hypothetical protein BDA96_02G328300 [Sorghum bicolor]|uniref:Uncharacterized protein n=1 Tax=Sorghum bicolor TaxID=4558 RepID=A0A921RSH3_SORBI|nr:hypothetical protein BDA96_02G328300 [Sorghum bicolor]
MSYRSSLTWLLQFFTCGSSSSSLSSFLRRAFMVQSSSRRKAVSFDKSVRLLHLAPISCASFARTDSMALWRKFGIAA